MPRGFLVRRKPAVFGYTHVRHDDVRTAPLRPISLQFETFVKPHLSPDSGYALSSSCDASSNRDTHAQRSSFEVSCDVNNCDREKQIGQNTDLKFESKLYAKHKAHNSEEISKDPEQREFERQPRNKIGSQDDVTAPKPPKIARRSVSDSSSDGCSEVEASGSGVRVISGDIDSKVNRVVRTAEAEAQLSSIENRIGDFLCRLCRSVFDDAFALALHSCPRMQHVEYPCPECDKVFNCPANLASHRRWHRPRDHITTKRKKDSVNVYPAKHQPKHSATLPNSFIPVEKSSALSFGMTSPQCTLCGEKFVSHAHLAAHVSREHAFLINRINNIRNHVTSFFERRKLEN